MTETAFRPIGRRKAPTTGASERKSSA